MKKNPTTNITMYKVAIFAALLVAANAGNCYLYIAAADISNTTALTQQTCDFDAGQGCTKTVLTANGASTYSGGCDTTGLVPDGCTTAEALGISTTICGCGAELCNPATMTSGVVALLFAACSMLML